MDNLLLESIDTEEKYRKVFRATTQSLWQGIIDARAGRAIRADVEDVAGIVRDVVALGVRRGYAVDEVDLWWNTEVQEAFLRFD